MEKYYRDGIEIKEGQIWAYGREGAQKERYLIHTIVERNSDGNAVCYISEIDTLPSSEDAYLLVYLIDPEVPWTFCGYADVTSDYCLEPCTTFVPKYRF